LIIFDNVSLSYDGKTVLKNFSWAVPEERLVVITGPSGSGKTTLLRIIAGLTIPTSGKISGTPHRVSYLFQEHRLIPRRTVLENLRLVSEKPDEWLERVGLADSVGLYPAELSGGMRQRAAIARALAFPAETLFLDEPFKELDDATAGVILDLLEEQVKVRERVILVTHDPEFAAKLAGTVARFAGPPLRLLDNADI
jgi:ABC-type nitrate/sulfonate/bicarbonate transport system ATPase subunit